MKNKEHLLSLMSDRATGDLDREKTIELDGLLSQHPDWDDDSMDLAAAAAELAMLDEELSMPSSLKGEVADTARFFFETHPPASRSGDAEVVAFTPKPEAGAAPRNPFAMWTGWLAAAAVLVFALIGRFQGPSDPVIISPDELRRQMLAQADDAVVTSFEATEDQTATGARGDIVWSASRQEGYMRIAGLAANDPGREQYQLWIFDKDRDDRYPIDGGVFDVPAGQDEVVIPIDAKLAALEPQLYAVTVEPPGGVVVSSRERIALLAKPGA